MEVVQRGIAPSGFMSLTGLVQVERVMMVSTDGQSVITVPSDGESCRVEAGVCGSVYTLCGLEGCGPYWLLIPTELRGSYRDLRMDKELVALELPAFIWGPDRCSDIPVLVVVPLENLDDVPRG